MDKLIQRNGFAVQREQISRVIHLLRNIIRLERNAILFAIPATFVAICLFNAALTIAVLLLLIPQVIFRALNAGVICSLCARQLELLDALRRDGDSTNEEIAEEDANLLALTHARGTEFIRCALAGASAVGYVILLMFHQQWQLEPAHAVLIGLFLSFVVQRHRNTVPAK